MPYIKQERRDELLEGIKSTGTPTTAGELNYVLTEAILYYLATEYDIPSYHAYNEVVGVLECVKQEFYRRRVAPYEDNRKEINGDVY